MTSGRPVPLPRAAALPLAFALLAIFRPGAPAATWLWLNGTALLLLVLDYLACPGASAVRVGRAVEPALSLGRRAEVSVQVARGASVRALSGELRDEVPEGLAAEGYRQRFVLARADAAVTLSYALTPGKRGDFSFGDLHVRLFGPLGLMGRQLRVGAATPVRVFPDLAASAAGAPLPGGALPDGQARRTRRRNDGHDFECLRPWAIGDDTRRVDWKATARYGEPMVRVLRPEQHQTVLILLDCGRHMAGGLAGRRKLDVAVDAALSLSRAALARGDRVGLACFARTVQSFVPPGRGPGQLRALLGALTRAEAAWEESQYGRAFDHVFGRARSRSLVVVITDLLDAEGARPLLERVALLSPRHLPLVVSLKDEEVLRAVTAVPGPVAEAYVSFAAQGMEDEARAAAFRLKSLGARVVRARAAELPQVAVRAYAEVKDKGLL